MTETEVLARLSQVKHPSPPLLDALKNLVTVAEECRKTIGVQGPIGRAMERVFEEVAKPGINVTDSARIMNHAGAIGLLCQVSVYISNFSGEADEWRDCIEQCLDDYCKITGGTWHRVLNRIEYTPPSLELPSGEEESTEEKDPLEAKG